MQWQWREGEKPNTNFKMLSSDGTKCKFCNVNKPKGLIFFRQIRPFLCVCVCVWKNTELNINLKRRERKLIWRQPKQWLKTKIRYKCIFDLIKWTTTNSEYSLRLLIASNIHTITIRRLYRLIVEFKERSKRMLFDLLSELAVHIELNLFENCSFTLIQQWQFTTHWRETGWSWREK